MLHSLLNKTLLLAVVVAMAGCSLPRGAAIQSEIISAQQGSDAPFAVEPVTRDSVDALRHWPATGWEGRYHWLAAHKGGQAPRIQAGDRVSLTIWDNEPNSLLIGAGQKRAQVAALQVGPNGDIFVPYVGAVRVRNMTPVQARRAVQDKLSDIAASAQVQLALESGPGNMVDLVGGVGRPGRYPLPDRNHSLMSLLAEAGGIDKSLRHPLVRLTRSGKNYQIPATDLFEDAAKNIPLRGRDQVVVVQDERYFTALGATGSERIVYFEKAHLTALEAMSVLGGLNDARANPQGILVLREYPITALREDGSGPQKQQTIFTLDLTSADGLFAARNFEINPGDTVLATESPVNSLRTILGLLGTGVGLSNAVNS